MTRLAAGCVIVKNNSILLIHRIDKDWWEVPGGKAEEGESLEETAVREAWEEIHAKVKIVRKLGKTSFNNFQFDLDYTWFLAELDKDSNPDINEPHNYDDIRYIPINELAEKKLSPSARNLLTEIEKGKIVL